MQERRISSTKNEVMAQRVDLETYEALIIDKKRFLIKVIVFFVCFYFALPLGIIFIPKVMAIQVFSHFTIAWVMAFLQFVMIWGLGSLYYYKAKRFDRMIEKIATGRYER